MKKHHRPGLDYQFITRFEFLFVFSMVAVAVVSALFVAVRAVVYWWAT